MNASVLIPNLVILAAVLIAIRPASAPPPTAITASAATVTA